MSGGGKTTQSTQSVQIPPEVMARYNAVNARAEDVAKTPFQQYGGEFVAGLTPTQTSAIGDINNSSNLAQGYFQAGTDLTLGGIKDVGPLTQQQIQYYQNPYTQAVVDPTLQALQQQQGQERSTQQSQAIRAGAFGGDRAGLERANLSRQQELGTAQAIAPLYQQGYNQAVQTATGQQGVVASDLARRLQGGQQIAALGTGAQGAALQGAQAKLAAGTAEQQTNQALDTAKYQQFLQERGYPYQQAQFLANIAMGTGALSGSTTTTTQPGSIFSDERLKDNIEHVGELYDGQPIYRFDYGDGKTQLGLIAQNVLDRKPEAVEQDPHSGYLKVDYRDATNDAAEMAHQSMGGAVNAPGEFSRGGYADGGGLVGADDLRAILAAQQQSFGPFGQSGLYGSKGAGAGTPGGSGIIPSANLPVPKLATAGGLPAQRQSDLASAIGTGKGIADMYKFGKEAKTDIGKLFDKKPEEAAKTPAPAATTVAKTEPAKVNPDVRAEGAKQSSSDLYEPNAFDSTGAGFYIPGEDFYRGGLVPQGYAGGGEINPYAPSDDPLADAIKEGDQKYEMIKPGQLPGQQSSTMGDIKNAAGAAGAVASAGSAIMEFLPMLMAMSDERVKHNKEQVGELHDGQPIYRYDFGDGKTQLGLLAQNVERTHPEAVAEDRRGLKMVDYHRATQDAANQNSYYRGGLVPREHHDGEDGNVVGSSPATVETVIPDYSAEADLPAVGAVETDAKGSPDYRAMAIEKAKKYGVDPNKMLITIQGESGFNPRAIGDDGSSAGLGQFHVGGISAKFPNPGMGNDYFTVRRPDLDEKLTPREKIKYLADPANAEDKLDYMAEHASKKGFGAWTAARNAGLVPGVRPTGLRADVPANGSQETQPRDKEPGLFDSIGDKLTSDSYVVPALSFLGSMLSSKSPFLGTAIGEGILGGVGGYQANKKLQAEMAKNVLDVVKDRFVSGNIPGTNQRGFFDKTNQTWITADQYKTGVIDFAKAYGVPPAQLGIAAPKAPSGPTLEGTTVKSGAGSTGTGTPTVAGTGTPTVSGTEPPAPSRTSETPVVAGTETGKPEAKSPYSMSETQLIDAIRSDPTGNKHVENGLVGASDPRPLEQDLIKQRAQLSALETGDPSQTQQIASVQSNITNLTKQINDLYKGAVGRQLEQNKEEIALLSSGYKTHREAMAKRDEAYSPSREGLVSLSKIYANYEAGRASNIKAEIKSWANQFGFSNLLPAGFDAMSNDTAIKEAFTQAFTKVANSQLTRAPAASLKEANMTVAEPTRDPGAIYRIAAKTIGDMDYERAKDIAFAKHVKEGGDRDPLAFSYKFGEKNKIEPYIASAFSEIPKPKGVTAAQVEQLARAHKFVPQGVDPHSMGTVEESPSRPFNRVKVMEGTTPTYYYYKRGRE